MWKREHTGGQPARLEDASGSVNAIGVENGSGNSSERVRRPMGESGRSFGGSVANIGKSVVIKGELNGREDFSIEGQVEGKIELREHVLTVGPNGRIKAQVFAKAVVVFGEVIGNITATDKVTIRENGSVHGDITAPLVAIAEGAHLRGSIDMQRGQPLKVGTEIKGPVKSGAASTQVARAARVAHR